MNEVRVRDLSVALGGTPVLSEVSFSVASGEMLALVGPNGSGKTTLLRTLSGVLPFDGDVLIGGSAVRQLSARERARRMAFVRQTVEVTFDFSVREFVLLGRSAHRGWLEPFTGDDRSRAQTALEEVEMESFAERPMTRLSGGEQQRVRLAQALCQEAPLLLLDEPTAHLDVHHQLDLMQRVRTLADDGRAVIVALHDLPLAAQHADRLLVLKEGRMMAIGPPEETITEELLEQVFRVRTHIPAGNPAGLRYLSPTP